MPDYVIDTNVLIIASAADSASPFVDTALPAQEAERVLAWVARFRVDNAAGMVWDQGFKLFDEYRKKLTGTDYGIRMLQHKLDTCRFRFVEVPYDDDGYGVIPERYHDFDRSDRSALAVLLAERGAATLVNAVDTDWLKIERQLREDGIPFEHIVESWLRAKHAEKESRK